MIAHRYRDIATWDVHVYPCVKHQSSLVLCTETKERHAIGGGDTAYEVGAAVKVMQIATDEIEEELTDDGKNKAAVELGRKGGVARARTLTDKQRSD